MRNAETVVGVHRERHGAHGTVTGEPVARKAGTAGSGRGPLEKDLGRTRHLASGLPAPHVNPANGWRSAARRALSLEMGVDRSPGLWDSPWLDKIGRVWYLHLRCRGIYTSYSAISRERSGSW